MDYPSSMLPSTGKELPASGHTDQSSDDRLRFEMLLADLSAAFVNIPLSHVDATIETWLQRLVEFLDVDRGTFLEFDDSVNTLTRTHSYATPGIVPLPKAVMNSQFPWITEQLRTGNNVIWARIPDDLPEEAVAERAYALQVGAKSGLNLPIAVDGRIVCAISFTSIRSYRQWEANLIPRLRLVGSVFANAMVRRRTEQALRRSEARYRALVTASMQIVWQADADGRVAFLTPAWRELTAQSDADISGHGWLDAVHPGDRERVRADWEEAVRRKQHYEAQFRVRASDGRYHDFHVRAVPVLDAEGAVREWAGASTEEASRRIERRYSELVATLEAIVWRADAHTFQFTFVSRQAQAILGFPVEQWLSEPDFWEAHVHPEDRDSIVASCRKATQEMRNNVLEYRMIAADGRTVWLHDVVQVIVEDGEPKELIGVMVDITDHKRAQTALGVLGGRLIHAQEDERRRIARELHDDLSQRLALLGIGLQQLSQSAKETLGDVLTHQVDVLQKQLASISSDVHRLSHNLHPPKLQHLGLASALSGLCREVAEQHGIQVQCVTETLPRSAPLDMTLCLFRIAQEALQNVVKHSGTGVARVELAVRPETIALSVSDDGKGFNPESLAESVGLGLVSMQERVRLFGGVLVIDSQPSQGTRITARLPFDSRARVANRARG